MPYAQHETFSFSLGVINDLRVKHSTSPALLQSFIISHNNNRYSSLHGWETVCQETTRRLWTTEKVNSFPQQPVGIESSLFNTLQCFLKESVNICSEEAGQSDSHLILESDGGTLLFPICQLTLDMNNYGSGALHFTQSTHRCKQNTIADCMGIALSQWQQLITLPCSI